jgi:hypothetical protein
VSERPARVLEPSARGPMEGRFHDWRGLELDAEVEAARAEARRTLGAAVAGGPTDGRAWAAAEAAVQHAIGLALDRLGARKEDPAARRLVVQVLTAPDTRARYVFLEDLLHWIKR